MTASGPDFDPYAAARAAAERGSPQATRTPAKTSTHRQTRLFGDGDARQGRVNAENAMAALYGRVDIGDPQDLQWHFGPTPNPWAEKEVRVWGSSLFAAHAGWLDRIRREALAESRKGGLTPRVANGLRKQSSHAAYLARLVKGWILKPWMGRTDIPFVDDDPIASALLRLYGPNPVPEFLRAMREHGIDPIEPNKLGAGNVLHKFDVRGDSPGTLNGWAILHRCPGAGTFGTWRTGAVYLWHSQPDRMSEASEQFEDDYRRAIVGRASELLRAA